MHVGNASESAPPVLSAAALKPDSDTSTFTVSTLVAAGGATSTFVDSTVVKGVNCCYPPSTVAGSWSAQAPVASARCVTP